MTIFSLNSAFDVLSAIAGELCTPSTAPSLDSELLAMYDELRRPLLRYALIFGLTLEDGEDVVQQTFIALFLHLKNGRSRENLPGWAFRVTHNLALKRRMQHKNEVQLEDRAEDAFRDPAPGPEDTALFHERQQRLRRVMQALSLRDQACLQLRAEGLRYREISRVLGISLGSVSNSLTTSLDKLTRTDRR